MATNYFEDVRLSCNNIMKSVRNSCLNFSLQETPFSLYLTVRKSKLKHLQASVSKCENDLLNHNPDHLKCQAKLQKVEEAFDNLKIDHEEAVFDAEIKLGKHGDHPCAISGKLFVPCSGGHD